MFSAYLHQDFDLEFGNVDEAISAFALHASDSKKKRALVELDMLLSSGLNEGQLREIIDGLGCCYFYAGEWRDGVSWLNHVFLLLKK